MSKYSVKFKGQWYTIVISRSKENRHLTPVWLSRGVEDSHLLCQVGRDRGGSWLAIAAGPNDNLKGLRSVEGFKTRWKAIWYAVEARKDLNDHDGRG